MRLECPRLEHTEERRAAYRRLIQMRVLEVSVKAARETINKAWVLESDHYTRRMVQAAERAR